MFGKGLELGNLIVLHVEDIVDLTTGDHQCVAFCHRVDVEESVELVAFGTFVAGNFASSDFTKNVHLDNYAL